jgi:uncharacterized membrane protein YqgA involved in biofilm formation
MPIGIIVNALSILIGGVIGALLGEKLKDDFKDKMNMIFACILGGVVCFIAVPQFIIFFVLFLCAGLIFPMTTDAMILVMPISWMWTTYILPLVS